jgi:CheY-like chemotaxis protein
MNRCATAKSQHRLLLAEDDHINQQVIEAFLIKLGYSADVVANGLEALRALTENDYALVLMDCMMPEMGGSEATAIIRDPASKVRNHGVPIIALTANAIEGNREKCLATGMNDYLAKPLRIASLAAILDKWLGGAPESPPVFDEAGFLKRHLDDQELAKDVVRSFTAKAPQYVAAINFSLAEGDAPGVQQQAQVLKSAAAMLGADKLFALAAELVELGRCNEMVKARHALPQLTEEFDCLLHVLAECDWFERC